MQHYHSNGKLLLTAEYLVLDGAKALATPVKYGQSLQIGKTSDPGLVWKSYLRDHKTWFSCKFSQDDLSSAETNDTAVAESLQLILKSAREMNPDFLKSGQGLIAETFLEFPRNWGLGSSSTLINNIAQWANVNPYKLLQKSFGGSGYDIACARNNVPVLFQLKDQKALVKNADFDPVFKEQLYFIHLNKKQDSRKAITRYRKHSGSISNIIYKISEITGDIIKCEELKSFEKLIEEHENIISEILKQPTVQQKYFSDYFGQTKSLGAWGGDFILATGNENTPEYFKNKGFDTVIHYKDMIL